MDAAVYSYYAPAPQSDIIYDGNPNGTGSSSLLTGRVWGILPTGPKGAFQSYNGGNAYTISQQNAGTASLIQDHFQGYSGEYNIPVGADIFSAVVRPDRAVLVR